MGSAVTLDIELLNKYFIAKKAAPESILNPTQAGQPPLNEDNSPEADTKRRAWLIKIKQKEVLNLKKKTLQELFPLNNRCKKHYLILKSK